MPDHPIAGLTRRQILRRLGIAAGTVAGLPLLNACRDMYPRESLRQSHRTQIAILGAGLAGLCAAYELEKKGYRVTILEAQRDHIGGRARTIRFSDGTYGEAGAMRIPAKHDLTRAYCKEMNLSLRPFVQSNPNAYFFVRNTKVRSKDAKNLNPLFQLRDAEKSMSSDDLWAAAVGAKLKSLNDTEKADLLLPSPKTAAIKTVDNLSLQQLFDQSGLSQEAIELMAVTQGQEAEMQYASTESLREEIKEVWSHEFDEIVGGTDRLPAALAKAIRGPILRGCEVIALNAGDAPFVQYRQNDEVEYLSADAIICTLPVPVLQRLSANFSPAKWRAIRQLTYDSATKVLIGTKERFWESNDGIYGGGTFTDLPTGSTYYPSDNATDRSGTGPRDPALSKKPAVFLASYSWGMTARRMAAMPHAQRLQVVKQHLLKIHTELAYSITRSASWAWDTHPWSGGAFAWFNPGQHAALYADLIAPEGNVHFAGEHASLSHTWMQGAFESALRAVTEILAKVPA